MSRAAIIFIHHEDDRAFARWQVWSKPDDISWRTAFATGSDWREHGKVTEFNRLKDHRRTVLEFREQVQADVALLVLPGGKS